MDEIIARFEIIRLAVRLADHDTVAVQIEKLKEICNDEDLSEIISLLSSKNFRQALYLMKAYIESLDDSFLEPIKKVSKPKRQVTEKPKEETQNLFDMMKTTERVINLDDMLKMTEDSVEDTVEYNQSQLDAQTYISQAKEETQRSGPIQRSYKEVNKIDELVDSKQEHDILADRDLDSPIQTIEEIVVDDKPEELKPLNEQIDIKRESIEESEEEKSTIDDKFENIEIKTSNKTEETIESVEVIEDIETETLVEDEEQPKPEEAFDVKSDLENTIDSSKDTLQQEKESVEETITIDSKSREKDMLDNIVDEAVQIQDPFDVQEVDIVDIDGENSTVKYVEVDEDVLNDLTRDSETEEPIIEEVDVGGVSSEVNYVEIGVDSEEVSDEESDVAEDDDENDSITEEPAQKYSPISYIDQKFRNMRHQFPQIETYEHGIVPELTDLLKQVATVGYTEDDIKEVVRLYLNAKSNGKIAEAAQLLLFAASSESQYAQLILARELYTGEILKADYPEAFTQINRLAEHDYPEAVCDLAQLYEHGHGIKRDKKTAILLYEEASQMGVARAQKHYDRLTQKKGLFGSLFKKK